MAKITIEELYRGEKYDIMSAVVVKAMRMRFRPKAITEPMLCIRMEGKPMR